MTQTEVQIESGPQSLRKIECTHCENYYLHMNINCRILIYVPMISVYTFIKLAIVMLIMLIDLLINVLL